jgi:hypothetical protein
MKGTRPELFKIFQPWDSTPIKDFQKFHKSQAPVTRTHNPTERPYLEKPITKKGWWSGSRWRPWVQAPVPPKKKKKSCPHENEGKHVLVTYQTTHAQCSVSANCGPWGFTEVVVSWSSFPLPGNTVPTPAVSQAVARMGRHLELWGENPWEPGMVGHACIPSTWEAEASRLKF